MLDHITLSVGDFKRSRTFYEQALLPLGYQVAMEYDGGDGAVAGFSADGMLDFWIAQGAPATPPLHVAFHSRDRATVDAWYRAALDAGGKDNGPPGLRPHYHPDYYGAFVLDPDGNNIEAVCHRPE